MGPSGISLRADGRSLAARGNRRAVQAGGAEPAILWQVLDLPADMEYKPVAGIEEVAQVLRRAVTEKEFIADDRFTAADVMIGSTIRWGTALMPVLPRYPELLAYWERLEQRPGWQRAHEADQKIMSAGRKDANARQ